MILQTRYSGDSLLKDRITIPDNSPILFVSPQVAVATIVARGVASQTANLFQAQNSAGTVLFSITAAGAFGNQITANAGIDVVGGGNALRSIAGAATVVPIVAKGAASQTASLQQWQNSAGTVIASVNPSGAFLSAVGYANAANAGTYLDTVSNTMVFTQRIAGTIGVVVKGAASQTADLQQWQSSAGTVLVSITSGGNFSIARSNPRLTLTDGGTTAIQLGADSGSTFFGTTTNHRLEVRINATEIARFDTSGNMLLGATSTATSSAKTIHISNGTAPTANLTGGGVLYVESGALKYRGSSGTITTLGAA
jgi:hypothetical protein